MTEQQGPGASQRSWRQRFAGRLAALALRALGATWRFSEAGPNPLENKAETPPGRDSEPGEIGAFWHRSVFVTAWAYRDRGFSVAVSRSRDGDWVSSMLPPLGYREAVRGSSSRGGAAALRGLVRCLKEGTTVAILCDGPRGPARQSKIGAVSLARLSGRPITPVAISAAPCIRFRSWDETMLPLPFARVRLHYGKGIEVAAGTSEDEEETLRERLDLALNELTDALESGLSESDLGESDLGESDLSESDPTKMT